MAQSYFAFFDHEETTRSNGLAGAAEKKCGKGEGVEDVSISERDKLIAKP